MAKSIIQSDRTQCFLCGRNGATDPLECHHVMFGPHRKKADADGLTVYLCGSRCHRNGAESVHRNRETDLYLKRMAQTAYEKRHVHSEWMRRYGKNYLEEK